MSEKVEVGIVSHPPEPGKPVPRIRMVKLPPNSESGDKYVVLMPGTLPGGLHLSIHVSGAVHLRATTPKGVATLDLLEVARRVAKVGPGPILRLMFRPPTPGHPAKGIVAAGAAATPVFSPGRADLDASRLVESMTSFELEDTRDVVPVLRRLREEGRLNDADVVQITVPDIDEQSFFRPLTGEMPSIPDGTPFADELRRFQSEVREAGGVFQTVGGRGRFAEEMRQIPGYDLIQEFVNEIASMLDDPSAAAEVENGLMPFFEDLTPGLKSAIAKGALPAPREP